MVRLWNHHDEGTGFSLSSMLFSSFYLRNVLDFMKEVWVFLWIGRHEYAKLCSSVLSMGKKIPVSTYFRGVYNYPFPATPSFFPHSNCISQDSSEENIEREPTGMCMCVLIPYSVGSLSIYMLWLIDRYLGIGSHHYGGLVSHSNTDEVGWQAGDSGKSCSSSPKPVFCRILALFGGS